MRGRGQPMGPNQGPRATAPALISPNGIVNLMQKIGELSRAPQSSEQFVWLNRRYGETETQLSPTAIMPSTRADSSQNAVI